ncbi:MAG: hypothetical protein JNL83_26310 [Myxococcales bacterium]|nr:hypothetical protein [Myxococcales bacterium]
MHRVNAGFTLVLPLRPESVDACGALLTELDADQARLPFARSTTTHFATITIIPAQMYRDRVLPATLLFATSMCGPVRVHVEELVELMGSELRVLFAHCEGFRADFSDGEMQDFMLARRHADTFYSGMNHLSPQCVKRHRELREAIEQFIDERQAQGGLTGSASEVRKEIQAFVRSRPDLAWTEERFEPTLRAWLAYHWRSLVVEGFVASLLVASVVRIFVEAKLLTWFVVGGWSLVVAFLALVVVLGVSISRAEAKQAFVAQRPPDDRARTLASMTNRPVINEFVLAGPIKPEGSLRPVFLQLAFWVVARVVEGVPGMYYVGSGIDIPTVATARWIVTDRGRRVMFISNFTNSAHGYIRDFIETRGGAMRINLSFGFGYGFPKTRWIVSGGALTDPNAYLYSLAQNQLPTWFWYGPHEDVSIDNIKVNRKIREGLFADLSPEEEKQWLHLL